MYVHTKHNETGKKGLVLMGKILQQMIQQLIHYSVFKTF